MLRINILNDGSGPDEAANYTYEVFVNLKRIAQGKVLGHDRDDTWHELVEKMIYDARREIVKEIAGTGEKESGKD